MTVLVAYDGSKPAQNAVEHAVTTYPDEELVLLRVIEVPDSYLDATIDAVQERLETAREERSAAISEEVRDLVRDSDVEFRIETTVGKPAREIVAFADENDVETIVVGNHGREGVSRVLLGNVAETVVRRAPVPVTVVR